MHRLFRGDMATVCAALDEDVPPLDLVYLDPPYGVGAVMTTRDEVGQARGRKSRRGGREAYADGADVDALVAMLGESLAALAPRLSPRGCVYLHLDWRAVHDAKVAADRVFGRAAYCGDVVWTPGNGRRGAKGFAVTHQTLLIYAPGGRRTLAFRDDHPLLREPYAETSLKMHFTSVDDDGRRFRERTVRGKKYRYYADEGRRLGSVWTDISAMRANTPILAEGTGYPTQKPMKLLERIIRASSRRGDTVADFMCGSGTTLAVAAALGRRFVGGDQSEVAIETTRARLDRAGVAYRFDDASRTASATAASIPRDEA
ncbi:MAG: site-specific DNA-methyltransferase [Myxococcota bacterium]